MTKASFIKYIRSASAALRGENDGVTVNRIKKVNDWIEHIKSVGGERDILLSAV